jgi:hypothetical protein
MKLNTKLQLIPDVDSTFILGEFNNENMKN